MALKHVFFALGTLASVAQGHYTFARLRHNGDWQKPYQFIRNKTNYYEGDGSEPNSNLSRRGFHWPTYIQDSAESVRCGRDNMKWAAQTEVLTVQAGDSFEIVIDAGEPEEWSDDNWYKCPDDRGSCWAESNYIWRIIHPGPVVVHLSPVPENQEIHEYDGSGEWLKIFTMGLEWRKNNTEPLYWFPHNEREVPPRITFTIPHQTPAGNYLMRMDQIYPSTTGYHAGAQLYPSCAQIRVESDSTIVLPSGILIPRDLDKNSTGTSYSQAMTNMMQLDKGWQYPGGPLWNGKELVQDMPVCPLGDPTECQAKK